MEVASRCQEHRWNRLIRGHPAFLSRYLPEWRQIANQNHKSWWRSDRNFSGRVHWHPTAFCYGSSPTFSQWMTLACRNNKSPGIYLSCKGKIPGDLLLDCFWKERPQSYHEESAEKRSAEVPIASRQRESARLPKKRTTTSGCAPRLLHTKKSWRFKTLCSTFR